jgi:hypothetical protein
VKFLIIKYLAHPFTEEIIGYPFMRTVTGLREAIESGRQEPDGGDWFKWAPWEIGWCPDSSPYVSSSIKVDRPMVNTPLGYKEAIHVVKVIPLFPISPSSLPRVCQLFEEYELPEPKQLCEIN